MRQVRLGVAVVLALQLCGAVLSAQQRDDALPPASPPPLIGVERPPAAPPVQTLGEAFEQLAAQDDDGFVPIDELPPEEQLPAAPMLVAAYIFVVLAIFAYLLSLSRRLAAVKQDIARLEEETRRSRRS